MSIPKNVVSQIPNACRALQKSFKKKCPKLVNDSDSIWKVLFNYKPSFIIKNGKKPVFVYAVEHCSKKGDGRFVAACLPPCIFVTRKCCVKDFRMFGYSYQTYTLRYVMHHELYHMFDKNLYKRKRNIERRELDANWESFRSVVFPIVSRHFSPLLDHWVSGVYPRSSMVFDPTSSIKGFIRTPSSKPIFLKRLKKLMLIEHNF